MVISSSEFFQSRLRFELEPSESRYFIETVGNGIEIDMTLVPSGTFLMGSPKKGELGRLKSEGPQHEVTVQSFFMGTYHVTQEQWRIVTSFDQVDRPLEPGPSRFKWNKHPVERVSWEDAIEFCKRLSHYTHRDYRLPSEAEWEYACRARTNTPFHFGTTITTDYANYCGGGSTGGRGVSYGLGPAGEYREKTTSVDHFDVSNGFGLFDMHGNVWEWCQDPWHKNYRGNPPNDGSVWIDGGASNLRVIRGGAWFDYPADCRCASRNYLPRHSRNYGIGFRVVMSAPGLRGA